MQTDGVAFFNNTCWSGTTYFIVLNELNMAEYCVFMYFIFSSRHVFITRVEVLIKTRQVDFYMYLFVKMVAPKCFP